MSITVVGSINMDIVARIDQYPDRGETIFGNKLEYLPGGKGANQATAVARLGKKVRLIGSIGDDLHGADLLEILKENKIDIKSIKRSKNAPTGTSIITIDKTGENTILVFKGANDDLTVQDIDESFLNINDSKILLVQMEVPHETVLRAMQLAKQREMLVILDPAPAEGIVVEALEYADIITPNQQEAEHLLGIKVYDFESALTAAQRFEKMGVKCSIIKMGSKGSLVYQEGKHEYIQSLNIQAVDTSGAGDAYAGALAVGILDGLDLFSAAKMANIVAGMKVTRIGAQNGLPTRKELQKFCKERNLPYYSMEESV